MADIRRYMASLLVAVLAIVGVCTDALAKTKHHVHRVTPVASTVTPAVPFAAMSIFCDMELHPVGIETFLKKVAARTRLVKLKNGCSDRLCR